MHSKSTIEKSKINRWIGVGFLLVGAAFCLFLLLQVAVMVFAPSKSACTKQVCLSRFLDGPPAFNDEYVKEYLLRKHFDLPSSEDYNLSGVRGSSRRFEDTSNYIRDHFKGKRNGKFVVLGAGDGEYRDVTLDLERELGWTGLLVEPNPTLYQKLVSKKRKAFTTETCVSPFAYPIMMKLSQPEMGGALTEEEELQTLGRTVLSALKNAKEKDNSTKEEKFTEFQVQCLPVENLVYAADIKDAIDLLVLDMSGGDLEILINARFDALPDFGMVVLHSNGNADIGKEVPDYFVEKNMVLSKTFGEDPRQSSFVLTKFRSEL